MTDRREARNRAGDTRTIRMTRTDAVRTVSYREAVGLVSRGLAVFHVEPAKTSVKKAASAKKATTKNVAVPVSAEAVYADPTSPITPQDLPGPAQAGDAADDGSNSPHDLL